MSINKPLKIQSFLRDEGSLSDLKSDPYNLKINTDDKKRRVVFNYNQIKSNMSNPIVQEARGLILDMKNDWKIISFPFKKFFNAGEPQAVDIDWSTARVWEKLDGSCSVLYNFENEWIMHTLGTVEGEGDVHTDELSSDGFSGTFNDLFFKTWDKVYGREMLKNLNKDFIYIFELMSPYNVVVKNHKESKLVLLGVRNKNTLEEYDVRNFKDKFEIPNFYDFSNPSIENLEESLKDFQPDEEGYVVCDNEFNRIKLKNPDYVMRHKMRDNILNRKYGVLEVILDEKEDDFISTFPELEDTILEVKESLKEFISFLEESYEIAGGSKTDPNDDEERKEFALNVKNDLPEEYRAYMFSKLTTSKSMEEIVKEKFNKRKVGNSLKMFNSS